MALPINQAPKYSILLPSTGQEYFFKPFLVKQEKALMLAMQSENQKNMVKTLSDVITECFEGKLDVKEIAMFDLEYIFAQVRAKSVGETISLTMKCEECPPEEKKARVNVEINVGEIPVEFPENQEKKIMLWDDVGAVMRYPSIKVLEEMDALPNSAANNPDNMYKIISACMESIFNSEEVFPISEQTPEEVKDFLDNLTNEQFRKIQAFFEDMPKMSKQIEYNCPVCGHHHDKRIEGLNSFFS